MNKIIWLLISFALATPAIAKDKRKSIDNRQDKSIGLLWRTPTLTFVDDLLATQVGVEGGAYLTPSLIVGAFAQTGIAGPAGHNSTIGNMHHAGVFARHFFGNAFYLSTTAGYRGLSFGLGDENYDFEDDERDSDQDYGMDYDHYGKVRTRSLGVGGAIGWQWQHNRVTIGLELFSIFQPLHAISARGKFNASYPDDDHDAAEVDRRADRAARAVDVNLPRLTLGFAW